jgi:hypothetical protein
MDVRDIRRRIAEAGAELPHIDTGNFVKFALLDVLELIEDRKKAGFAAAIERSGFKEALRLDDEEVVPEYAIRRRAQKALRMLHHIVMRGRTAFEERDLAFLRGFLGRWAAIAGARAPA